MYEFAWAALPDEVSLAPHSLWTRLDEICAAAGFLR